MTLSNGVYEEQVLYRVYQLNKDTFMGRTKGTGIVEKNQNGFDVLFILSLSQKEKMGGVYIFILFIIRRVPVFV